MKKSHLKKSITTLKPTNINYLIVWLLILTTIGTFSDGVSYTNAYRECIAEVGAIGLLLCWLYSNRHTTAININISVTRLWFGALAVLGALSVFWSAHIGFFASKYLMWLGAMGVFLLVLNLKTEAKTYTSIAQTLVFIGIYISIIGLIQALFSVDIFKQTIPPAANFMHKNRAAQIIILVLPLSVFLLLVSKKYLSNFYPFAITLMLAYLFHTQTRAAWLGLGVEILLLTIAFIVYRTKTQQAFSNNAFHWSTQKTFNSILAIILLLLLINVSSDGWTSFTEVVDQQANSIVDSIQDAGTAHRGTLRYKIWKAALLMIVQNPLFGSGIGSFYHNMLTQSENYTVSSANVHNDILELGIELGLLGWLLFVGIVVSLLFNIVKLIQREKPQQQLFYWMIAIALSGSFVNMQFSFPYQMIVPLVIFSLYSALLIKGSDPHNKIIRTFAVQPKYAIIFVATIFVLVLSINITWLSRFADINNGFLQRKWAVTEQHQKISCHKLLVRTLEVVAKHYEKKDPQASLQVLKQSDECIPNHWKAESLTGINLLKLQRYDLAIKAFEKAKQHHVISAYQDYVGQYIAYIETGNTGGAQQIYQELIAKPVAELITKRATLTLLIKMSINLNNKQNALKFYKLCLETYGMCTKTIETLMKDHIDQPE